MKYDFRLKSLAPYVDQLIDGALMTIALSASAMAIGLSIGIVCALLKAQGPRAIQRLVGAYVEIIRNTPLLVQCFFVFFGLPSIGIYLTANQAALIALSVNLGAYATEIVRAGVESIPRGQIEAGVSLALTKVQVFRHVILFPALKNVYPALASQFILLLIGSSVVSQISADELFYKAAFIDSRTFLSFEIYLVVTVTYLVLALAFRAIFGVVHQLLFRH
jgi:polar amino acid transport system permease protein